MKRVLSTAMMVVLCLSVFPLSAFAGGGSSAEPPIDAGTAETIEYFADGSYLITTLETGSGISPMAASTKTGSKSYHYYDSDDAKVWTVTIIGTFSYTGSSVTCTGSSTSYTVYDSDWKVKEATATKSGNKAIGNFTVRRYFVGIPILTMDRSLTLSCSATGVLS